MRKSKVKGSDLQQHLQIVEHLYYKTDVLGLVAFIRVCMEVHILVTIFHQHQILLFHSGVVLLSTVITI